jgi:hypothetical protein
MGFVGFQRAKVRAKDSSPESTQSAHTQCEAIGAAINKGDIGETITAVQQLILRYYDNVRDQAEESFESAKRVALFGFVLLVVTVVYVMFMDLMPHVSAQFETRTGGLGVGAIGLIGSSVVEVIAGVQFVLYGRATRQFGAFHICLERTHRYLLAYEMADQMKTGKDATLEKIVCIMANAPMITREDIEGVASGAVVRPKSSGPHEVSQAIGKE